MVSVKYLHKNKQSNFLKTSIEKETKKYRYTDNLNILVIEGDGSRIGKFDFFRLHLSPVRGLWRLNITRKLYVVTKQETHIQYNTILEKTNVRLKSNISKNPPVVILQCRMRLGELFATLRAYLQGKREVNEEKEEIDEWRE